MGKAPQSDDLKVGKILLKFRFVRAKASGVLSANTSSKMIFKEVKTTILFYVKCTEPLNLHMTSGPQSQWL